MVKFVAFLFYRYYNSGKNPVSIPYFRTISSLVMLAVLHLFQLILLLGLKNIFWNDKIPDIVQVAIILLPLYLGFFFSIPHRLIKNLQFEEKQIKKGNKVLLFYIIASTLATALIGYFKIIIPV